MSLVFNDRVDESEYLFGDPIDNEEFSDSLKSVSLVSYKYIDYKETDYHFFQECFDNNDIRAYFDFMSMLSSDSFSSIWKSKERDWHLNPNDYNKDAKFKGLVNKALHIEGTLPVENQPQFYHFALYTNQNASRTTGVKSPRIYFFIGTHAVIYPLFYDPYHEINP